MMAYSMAGYRPNALLNHSELAHHRLAGRALPGGIKHAVPVRLAGVAPKSLRLRPVQRPVTTVDVVVLDVLHQIAEPIPLRVHVVHVCVVLRGSIVARLVAVRRTELADPHRRYFL